MPSEDLAKAYWKRLDLRTVEPRSHLVGGEGVGRAGGAIYARFGQDGAERMSRIKIPVLIANGDNDLVFPTINSYVLKQKLSNARLYLYPNAGHGFLFQYAEEFGARVVDFLA